MHFSSYHVTVFLPIEPYESCTNVIAESSSQIRNILCEIQSVAKGNQYSPDEIWLTLSKMNFTKREEESRELVDISELIGKMAGGNNCTNSKEFEKDPECNQTCLKVMRDIIVQLKMIQWGYHGPAEATAGVYIAHHRKMIGGYFENSLNNEWPYQPLHREPDDMELQFNEYLMKMTEEMSNGRLKNISILDLPAFGSPIQYLDLVQTSELKWPNELNFAIYNKYKNSTERALAFSQYKMLMGLWKLYLENVNEYRNQSSSPYPPCEASNPFNFTQHIQEDFSTFWKVYAGSFPTALKDSSNVWGETAGKVFGQALNQSSVEEIGLYDKLIMDCSFKERLMKKAGTDADLSGGCKYFDHTLTSNGLCYSFNGLAPSSTWRPSNVIQAFNETFNTKHGSEKFGGAGSNQGM